MRGFRQARSCAVASWVDSSLSRRSRCMESASPEIAKALAEQLPPLTPNAASVEADRCLYCYDAPCTHACPTHIDIPRFIKKIATRNLRGSARPSSPPTCSAPLVPASAPCRNSVKAPACWAPTTSPSPSAACNATRWTMPTPIGVYPTSESRAHRPLHRRHRRRPRRTLLRRTTGPARPRCHDLREA